MWNFLTKAFNKSSSSIQVTVLNSATNFCMTAILGNVIFGEALALQWWFGAGFIVFGTVLVNMSNAVVEDYDKEKKTKITRVGDCRGSNITSAGVGDTGSLELAMVDRVTKVDECRSRFDGKLNFRYNLLHFFKGIISSSFIS
ncbi:2856_t:CDS:2 [Dentiscutata heterogama]|uniref:2856_t:CDS:1 n=1 Tax=Dentiscutata heterogama TaxID=1316150 RepID=A0ACA9K087_9GLOM|nr:2856_t:CDS:2 [Dentiscutata heterogama]